MKRWAMKRVHFTRFCEIRTLKKDEMMFELLYF